MKVATRLRISAVASVGILVFLCLLFVLLFKLEQDTREKVIGANELMKGAYELYTLSGRYVRYPEEGSKEQWTLQYGILTTTLKERSLEEPGQHLLFDRMAQNLKDMRMFFDELVAMNEKTSPNAREAALHTSSLLRSRDQISDLMLKRLREISLDATRIAALNTGRMEKLSRRVIIFVPAVAILLIVPLFWFLAFIARRITDPINRLRAGTETIGAGNLDHRIGMTTRDEIGELSKCL